MARLEREAQEREDQRRIEERNEIRKKAAKERLEQLRSTALGAKVFKEVDAEVPNTFLESFAECCCFI